MRRQAIVRLFALVLFSTFASGETGATTIQLHSLETLAGVAELVTHGSVTEARTERDAKGEIWSVYTLVVHEELKDAAIRAGTRLEIRQFGGTLDDETVLAVGFPQFVVGEELLLFLQEGEPGYRILNAWQGALRISEEPSLAGGEGVKRLPSAATLFAGTPSQDLPTFKGAVRDALEASRP